MGVKVEGIIGVEEMLLIVDNGSKKRILKALIKEAKKLQALAIKMAPVDEVNLEKSILMRPDEGQIAGGRERDDAGRFVRTEVEVYIDMAMPIPKRPGKTVGDYAYEIHEHLSPMGSMNLGDKSNIKQISNPDVVVGGGFMTRAADVIERGLDLAMIEALMGLI